MKRLNLKLPKTKTPLKWGSVAHVVVNAILPLALLGLVLRELSMIALLLVLVSKWRTFAVTPRYWFANLRANAIDIIVGVSTVLFLSDAQTAVNAGEDVFSYFQLAWTAWYALWLLYIKPRSGPLWVALQAGLGQVLGVTALALYFDDILDVNILPETIFVVLTWIIAVSGARHFLSTYEEPYIGVISLAWGFIIAQLAWLTNHWLIVFDFGDVVQVPQITLLIGLGSFVVGQIYYLYQRGTLTQERKNQMIIFGCAIILMFTFLSDWSGNV